MARIIVPLARGVEEMEAVILIDVLRRAGWTVQAAGIGAAPIVASRGVRLVPDLTWEELRLDEFDGMVLPGGGEGAANLAAHSGVLDALKRFHAAGKLVAAICAAPTVLHKAGILDGRRATSFPSFRNKLAGTRYLEDRVVVDGNVITSRGPGTAFEFALAIIRYVDGAAAADKVREPMLLA